MSSKGIVMEKAIIRDEFFLSQPSKSATPADLPLAKDLQDTLAAHRKDCLGLAANMIGSNRRAIIITMGPFDLVMFNPTLITRADPYETKESCLSLSGERSTQRYRSINVSYMDQNWQTKTIVLKDLPAQICQHEMDHLDGILI